MNATSRSFGRWLIVGSLLGGLLNHWEANAATLSNFFSGMIPLDGDISRFLDANGNPLPGVNVVNNPLGLVPGLIPSQAALDANSHPSGFSQRRIMSAYNPTLYGGTIYVGIDLPGGTGANSSSPTVHSFPGNPNPNYYDGFVGGPYGGSGGRGKIVPFDGDGNGEADTLGRNAGGGSLFRFNDADAGATVEIK